MRSKIKDHWKFIRQTNMNDPNEITWFWFGQRSEYFIISDLINKCIKFIVKIDEINTFEMIVQLECTISI